MFYDNVFEKDWKMLELRALCFLPDQLLFTPALLRIKLSNLDNTHYIRFTWRIITAKTNSYHYIYFQHRLTLDHMEQLQFLSNLTLRRRVPLHTDFLPLPFTWCVTRKIHAIFRLRSEMNNSGFKSLQGLDPTQLRWVPELFQGIRRLGREDHSPPSSADGNNVCSYTSTAPT